MLTNTVYSFGSPSDQIYGRMVLVNDGTIYGYDHHNERTWRLDEHGVLWFYHQDGYPTASFMRQGDNVWIGRKHEERWPLFLLPVLENNVVPLDSAKQPPVFINTLPKSGTYFLEAAFKQMGWQSLRWHLGDTYIIDDYSALPDSDVHIAPQKSRLSAPLHLASKIVQPQQLLVGHVAHKFIEEAFSESGFLQTSCVRNLRDVLVSLFRFKLNKVSPLDQHDKVWRLLPDSDKFLGFLSYYRDKDIAFLIEMTQFLLNQSQSILLRYEEIEQGVISKLASDQLNAIDEGLAERLAQACLVVKDQSNPTFSGSRSDWKMYWSDGAEVFFKAYFYELNQRLGYEV